MHCSIGVNKSASPSAADKDPAICRIISFDELDVEFAKMTDRIKEALQEIK